MESYEKKLNLTFNLGPPLKKNRIIFRFFYYKIFYFFF